MVGQAAVQFARIAGFSPILVTASPRNHEALHRLGATRCFDYRSSTAVDEIRAAVRESNNKLSVVFDAVSTGLGVFEGLTEDQHQAITAQFGKSSPALARSCVNEDVPVADLRLCASLPVEQDPAWKFCSSLRLIDGQEGPVEGTARGIQFILESVKGKGYGNRILATMEWLLRNHVDSWVAPKIRTVKGAEAGISAIQDVFEGKVSGEKVVIEHPL